MPTSAIPTLLYGIESSSAVGPAERALPNTLRPGSMSKQWGCLSFPKILSTTMEMAPPVTAGSLPVAVAPSSGVTPGCLHWAMYHNQDGQLKKQWLDGLGVPSSFKKLSGSSPFSLAGLNQDAFIIDDPNDTTTSRVSQNDTDHRFRTQYGCSNKHGGLTQDRSIR